MEKLTEGQYVRETSPARGCRSLTEKEWERVTAILHNLPSLKDTPDALSLMPETGLSRCFIPTKE
jgi:hypothetical protein